MSYLVTSPEHFQSMKADSKYQSLAFLEGVTQGMVHFLPESREKDEILSDCQEELINLALLIRVLQANENELSSELAAELEVLGLIQDEKFVEVCYPLADRVLHTCD